MGLDVTIGALAVQLVLLAICFWQDRKPVNPAKPRMLPYRLFMLVLLVSSLATLAHLIALLTGNPIEPRRRRGT
jgi:hypothetical protein